MSNTATLIVYSRKESAVSAFLLVTLLVHYPMNKAGSASLDDALTPSVVTVSEQKPQPPAKADIDEEPIASREEFNENLDSSFAQLIEVAAIPSDTPASEFHRGRSNNFREAMLSPVIGEQGDARKIELQCVDSYLWSLYQRTPKEDSIKVRSQRKVAVKRKGKRVVVTRTVSKSISENFSWKDPKAAERFGKSLPEYVIGGMDTSFKVRLAKFLRAAELAGHSPGITSAFRDDYRQSIASGMKAATNRSYHGGSLRGGYGHGLAADVVSVNGGNRLQRIEATRSFWKWIDEHGIEFGIGRPYLDRDAPHVGPTDGKEFSDHRLSHPSQTQSSASKPTSSASRAANIEPDYAKL